MKTILFRLLPGVAACCAVAILISLVRAQSTATPAAAANSPRLEQAAPLPQVIYAAAPAAPAQIVVCGACGAELQAPRAVVVAQPVNGQMPRGGAFYGQQPMGQPVSYEVYRPGAPMPCDTWQTPAWRLPPSRYAVPTHRHDYNCGPSCRY